MIIPASLVESAPGLLGRIISYIEEDAIYSQPQLALGASLAFLSVMKAHTIRSESNLRTNMVCIGLADSGAGKDHALEKIQNLLEGTGFSHLISGVPGSDVALLRCMQDSARTIILWDEMGLDLKQITSPKVNPHAQGILKVIMSTFSSAGRTVRGTEYRNNDGKSPRITVTDPSLTIYGVSTPSRFLEALRSDYAIDGFIPRIFVFEGLSKTEIRYKNFKRKSKANSLALLGEEVRERFAPKDVGPDGQPQATPQTEVTFGKDAMEVLADQIEIWESMKEGSPETKRAIYARATEHFIKLCLVVEEREVISKITAEWVSQLMRPLILSSVGLVGDISDNEEEKQKKSLTRIIQKEKIISKRDLSRKTPYLSSKQRDAFLKDLIESETVEAEFIFKEGSQKKTLFYKPL